jgi:hypothetical protein
MAMLRGGMQLALADFLSKAMDPDGYSIMHQIKDGICKNCTVLAVKMDVVFDNGTRADVSRGVYLHHVIAFNIGGGGGSNRASGLNAPGIPFCSLRKSISSIRRARSVMPSAAPKGAMSIFGFGAVDEFKQWFTVCTTALLI